MNFIKVETSEGVQCFATKEATHFDVKPLRHAALTAVVTETTAAIPVNLRNVYRASEDGILLGGPKLNVTIPITYHGQVRFYGLVVGGWLPPLVGNGRVALLDRNMVHRLKTLPPLSENDSSADPHSPDWLYQLFARGTFEVSLAPHILEGKTRRPPTMVEMSAEMQDLAAQLKSQLPNAKIHQLGTIELSALYALLLERQDLAQQRTSFLLEVAPMLAHAAKHAARLDLQEKVLAAAKRAGLRKADLCVIAALSCIYEDPRLPGDTVYRPGRAVLKPKPTYTAEHAYNAIADLNSLEILVNSVTMLKNYQAVFFTKDIGLVGFWSALEACEPISNAQAGKSATTLTVTLSHALLPTLTEPERADLAECLKE